MEDKIVNIEKYLLKKKVPVPPPAKTNRPKSKYPVRAPTPTTPLNGQTFHLNITDEKSQTKLEAHNALPGKKLKRVQSAHAKLTSKLYQPEVSPLNKGILKQTVFSFTNENKNQKTKDPERRVTIAESELPKKNSEKKKKRPASAPVTFEPPASPPPPSRKAFLEPVVVSCKSGKQICGQRKELNDPLSKEETAKWEELDGLTIEDLIDYDDDDTYDVRSHRSFPKTLRPLLPHLTEDIPSIMTGVDSSRCLIFLPSMNIHEAMNLPVVPAPQEADEELMYIEKLPAPGSEAKPKRYKHPRTPNPIEDKRSHASKKNPENDMTRVTSFLQFFSQSGDLMMETPRGERTTEVVRQEIKELEDLMQGVGTADGCCAMARYQADINYLQSMLRDTMPRVEEVERKIAEKEANEHTDFFGLKAFYKEHDDVMKQIKTKYAQCIRELKDLGEGFTNNDENGENENQN